MLEDKDGQIKVQCLLQEYNECANCFRHTYSTIWQSGALFATFSAAIFGFFFSFQKELSVYLPYLPFIALASMILWWFLIFEPMNRYGDVREKRLKDIENELNEIVPNLSMLHFNNYGGSKGKFLRVRTGTRILAGIIILVMILLVADFLLHLGLFSGT